MLLNDLKVYLLIPKHVTYLEFDNITLSIFATVILAFELAKLLKPVLVSSAVKSTA
jgi:hypothetical protein